MNLHFIVGLHNHCGPTRVKMNEVGQNIESRRLGTIKRLTIQTVPSSSHWIETTLILLRSQSMGLILLIHLVPLEVSESHFTVYGTMKVMGLFPKNKNMLLSFWRSQKPGRRSRPLHLSNTSQTRQGGAAALYNLKILDVEKRGTLDVIVLSFQRLRQVPIFSTSRIQRLGFSNSMQLKLEYTSMSCKQYQHT